MFALIRYDSSSTFFGPEPFKTFQITAYMNSDENQIVGSDTSFESLWLACAETRDKLLKRSSVLTRYPLY